MAERLEDQDFNLQERQVDVEGIDPAEAIINFETQKFAYNAALQMGARIIQPSIFDFMR
jgi:flagellar hook-associated protein 3 FlgL